MKYDDKLLLLSVGIGALCFLDFSYFAPFVASDFGWRAQFSHFDWRQFHEQLMFLHRAAICCGHRGTSLSRKRAYSGSPRQSLSGRNAPRHSVEDCSVTARATSYNMTGAPTSRYGGQQHSHQKETDPRSHTLNPLKPPGIKVAMCPGQGSINRLIYTLVSRPSPL